MSPGLQDLKDAAAGLPAREWAKLARFLLRSLDEPDEGAVRAQWLALAERRMADVRAGKVAGVPAEELVKDHLEPRR